MAEGRTFQQLHELTGGFAWTLRIALNDELRQGRVRLDGDRYVLVPEAFPADLLGALRGLAPGRPIREHPSNGRRPFVPPRVGRSARRPLPRDPRATPSWRDPGCDRAAIVTVR